MHAALMPLVVILMLALSAAGGWVLTSGVLHLAGRSSDAGATETVASEGRPGPAAAAVSDGPDGELARAVLRGGTWIGLLERIAVTGCLLAGESSGIAIVVAVKGLGRYPELRENPGASERFVIGTLTSMLWAALVGLAGRAFLMG